MKNNIELLAPAGSYESLHAAIKNGANAIYFGINQLNMRAVSAANFDSSDLKKITKICKENKIKSYLTINTVLYDNDLLLMKKIIDDAKKYKVDALIVSDIAAMQYARSINIEVHASTQLSISNIEAVKFYSQFVDRIVLARELNLDRIENIIKEIKKQKIKGTNGKLIEIEVFIHGALCIAVSGRCSMSLYQYNSSADRGACRQLCRRKYKVSDCETNQELIIDNNYVMSPKDICTISFLDKIISLGVKSLKIEGRGRSPEYVATVVNTYNKAIKLIKKDKYTEKDKIKLEKELKKVFNRGLSDGYYLGKKLQEWSASGNSQATEEKIFTGIVKHYYPKIKVAEILLQAYNININDKYSITGKNTGVIFGKISKLRSEDRKNIKKAKKGDIITIPVLERVRENDKFYIIKKK